MDDTQEMADRLLAIQAEVGGHAGHGLGYYDPEDGVVCGCRAILDIRVPEWDELSDIAIPEPSAEAESALVVSGRGMVGHEVDPITAQIALIDPTKPYGPKEVELHIIDSAARLERGIVYEAALIAAAHTATMDFELAKAKALLLATGGDVKRREAQALVACEAQYVNMIVAVRARDAMKATTHSLRSVLSSYQSVAKSVAAAYGATNQTDPGRRDGRHF
jgi:hypothetical protein